MPSPVSGRPAQRGLGRLEQGCVPVAAVGCELEVIAQGRERGRVDRHGPGLRALAADPEVRHAPVLVERSDGEARDLVAAESVVEEDGEECPVAPRLEAAPLRSAEQPACLGVGERRCPAFVRVLHPGPLHARDRILVDGVGVTEVAEERGHGREFPGPGRRAETALLEHLPPGDDVGTPDEGELAEAADPEHRHELPDGRSGTRAGCSGCRRWRATRPPPARRPAAGTLPPRSAGGRRRPVPSARSTPAPCLQGAAQVCPYAILLPIMYFINSTGRPGPPLGELNPPRL